MHTYPSLAPSQPLDFSAQRHVALRLFARVFRVTAFNGLSHDLAAWVVVVNRAQEVGDIVVLYGGFLECPKWMVYTGKSIYKSMMNGGTPISGNLQIGSEHEKLTAPTCL